MKDQKFFTPCFSAPDFLRRLRFILLVVTVLLPLASIAQQMATTLTGSVLTSGSVDGSVAHALFNDPTGLAIDDNGNVYIADNANHAIRKLSSSGIVTTLAGRAGQPGSANGTGTNAFFNNPSGIALAGNGTIYVCDTGNNTIRSISTNGAVTTLAGLAGQSGTTNGTGNHARFNSPLGIAVDQGGTIYVADSGNHTIRKITPAGVVTTLAGSPAVWGNADGDGGAALFNCPVGVVVDGSGNLFVSDANNYTIRKITSAGTVSTWAGLAGVEGMADGVGAAARFGKPAELKLDQNNNLYVVDSFNCVIRKITTNAVVTTVTGSPGVGGALDGLGAQARFFNPYGLAIDHNGNLLVSDTYNETIRFVYNPIAAWLSRNTAGDGVMISWQAVVGDIYQVQYQEELAGGVWQNLGGTVTATTTTCYQTDGLSPSIIRRFYRVMLMP